MQLPDSGGSEQSGNLSDSEIASEDIPGEHLSPDDFSQVDYVEDLMDSFQEDPIEFVSSRSCTQS